MRNNNHNFIKGMTSLEIFPLPIENPYEQNSEEEWLQSDLEQIGKDMYKVIGKEIYGSNQK
jgi:hypothetical protein